MTPESLRNCKNIYLDAFILPKQSDITVEDMVLADLWLNRGKTPVAGSWEFAEICF